MNNLKLNQLHPGSKIILISFFVLILVGLLLSMSTASKTVKIRQEKAKTLGVKYDDFFDEDDKFLHFKDAHVHLFGHALVYLSVATVFCFSGAKEVYKILTGVIMLITLIVHTYALINLKIPIEIVAMVVYTLLLIYMMLSSVIAMYRKEGKD